MALEWGECAGDDFQGRSVYQEGKLFLLRTINETCFRLAIVSPCDRQQEAKRTRGICAEPSDSGKVLFAGKLPGFPKMERDMDLFRSILLELERQPYGGGWVDITIPGRSQEEISYHVQLLADAELIEAINLSTMDGVCWRPRRMTYRGHEFLDAARNDTLWARAKDTARGATGTLTLEALKITLAALIKKGLAASLGGP